MPLKNLIPPIIFQLKSYKRSYATYNQAISTIKDGAYQNETLCKVIATKTHVAKDICNSENLKDSELFLLNAINAYSVEYNTLNITVVDFGGACGMHYFVLRNKLHKNIKLRWIVVETTQMVKAATEKNLQNAELFFTDSLDNINDNIDILHTSGTLHYVPEPIKTLQQLLKVKANYLVFNRVFFCLNNQSHFIVIQTSTLANNGVGELPKEFEDATIKYPFTLFSYAIYNNEILNKYKPIIKITQAIEHGYIGGKPIHTLAELYQLKNK